jgi:hypothetical protein
MLNATGRRMMSWTREQDQEAKTQGWLLSNNIDSSDLEIQKLDDAIDGGSVRFEWDEDAVAFVEKQATSGDALALAALAFLADHNNRDG